uniref:ABC-type xenobiotic transporter n=1 Tax=Timema californicum TaxID=61474 RepID=A0A7R9IX46_TIMCA|nr:unnamed protein product [Timema californicum]
MTLEYVSKNCAYKCLRLLYLLSSQPTFVAREAIGLSMAIVSVYLVTLLPSDVPSRDNVELYTQSSETQALLGSPLLNTYSRFREEQDPLYLGVAMEDTTFLSKLIFHWVAPLMKKGVEGNIRQTDDLYDLPASLNPAYLGNKLYGAMSRQAVVEPGPLLLNRLVTFIENKNERIEYGYAYAAGLFGVTLLSDIGEVMNFMSTDTDRIVNSCPSFHALWSIPFQIAVTLYLLYNQVGLAFLTGVGFTLILIPINKFVATKIGELSTKMMSSKDERVKLVAEVLQGIRAIKFHVWEEHFLHKINLIRDKELKYLRGRKYLDAICVYFWATTPVLISILTFTTYVLMGNKLTAATVFTSMALLNMLIAPLNAFPWVLNGLMESWVSLKRIQRLMKMPDLDLKSYYTTLPKDESELVALIKNGTFIWGSQHSNNEEITSANCAISNVNLRVKKGELVGVMGRVGSGKSSLFAALSAELEKISGVVALANLEEGMGLVAQQAWLQRGTVRDNILFGKNFDDVKYSEDCIKLFEQQHTWTHSAASCRIICVSHCSTDETIILPVKHRTNATWLVAFVSMVTNATRRLHQSSPQLFGQIYTWSHDCQCSYQCHEPTRCRISRLFGYSLGYPERNHSYLDRLYYGCSGTLAVLEACCLQEDIDSLPKGDLTGVGEGGTTLSGGQKARVSLARAVYQDKKLYLLDDILSAVDVQVARHIFQKCVKGVLKDKTCILCTHHPQYLLSADHVIIMEDGSITKQGKPSFILSDYDEFLSSSEYDMGDSKAEKKHGDTIGVASLGDTTSLGGDSLLEEEGREVGTVRFGVYLTYWKAVGHLLGVALIVAMILMQSSRNLTDLWLSYWVTHANSTLSNVSYGAVEDDTKYYLTVYGILAGLNSVFTLLRAFLFAYAGLHAATSIHKLLLNSIMRARILFFDLSPLGRILNRFSSDTYTVDDSLPFIMNILLAQFFSVIGTVFIIIYGLPWLVLILAPLVPIYHWLQNHYRLTSRELKRLSSTTLSPMYSHFGETLAGIATVRSFRATSRFKRENEYHLELNQKCQYASQAAGQWLGLRLQFIGVAMITGVGVIAVLQHQFDVANPGLIGLAISYALSITGSLNGLVNAFTETEKEMIAVERVSQYVTEVEPERSRELCSPPYGWPSQGVIVFKNVFLKYREHLIPSLDGVTFETRPAEKIGVVGRTGAGKSSLLVALFRMCEIDSGEIFIDTVNIAHIGLTALRSKLAIIPQDPFLFSGTVRENLDPLEEHRDPQLWDALQRCHLVAAVRKLGGLEAHVGPGGSHLSVGQRQLVCLVRAVLHNAKILCIDEATANVDQETDSYIQQTLRSSFRQSTVITIAHRVRTIMDSDRVMVMANGRVIEFDTPEVLLQDKSSQFYQVSNYDFQ